MTDRDIDLNRTNPARRLGAIGLVLAVARWQWQERRRVPSQSSFSHSDRYKAYQSAIREYELRDIAYVGYLAGISEGRRLAALVVHDDPCECCGDGHWYRRLEGSL